MSNLSWGSNLPAVRKAQSDIYRYQDKCLTYCHVLLTPAQTIEVWCYNKLGEKWELNTFPLDWIGHWPPPLARDSFRQISWHNSLSWKRVQHGHRGTLLRCLPGKEIETSLTQSLRKMLVWAMECIWEDARHRLRTWTITLAFIGSSEAFRGLILDISVLIVGEVLVVVWYPAKSSENRSTGS